MRSLAAAAFAVAFVLGIGASDAGIVVHIDKSAQRMSVRVDGRPAYNWAISTGRSGYNTPNGTFQPQRLARTWRSRKYHWAPMPYSVFFHGGYAIHGSYETGRLGRPASHGCIRLHPSNAAKLFALVQQRGLGGTRIVITGHNPRPVYAGAHARPSRGATRVRDRVADPPFFSPSQYELPGPWYRQM